MENMVFLMDESFHHAIATAVNSIIVPRVEIGDRLTQ